MKPKILILNGPNLNMLGQREPDVYGTESLDDIQIRCQERAGTLDLDVDFRQSNHEGDLVEWIQEAGKSSACGLILNAGAYTHTSIAILDALRAVDLPVIEVHLSNIHRREAYRSTSYISQASDGMICGFGGLGYELALDALANMLNSVE